MLTVTLTRGLPGSGKTTWAHEQLKNNPGNIKIVCKDDLRKMLDNGWFNGKSEGFIIDVRDELILLCLTESKHVIVCDTNLNPFHVVHIESLVAEYNEKHSHRVEVKIKDFTDISIEECIKRDLMRINSVGEKVIRDQYNKWLRPTPEVIIKDPNLPNAIIVDVDGTLALNAGRAIYNFETALTDLPNMPVVRTVRMIFPDAKRIIMTGREEKFRQVTETWLNTNGVMYDFLVMRADNDNREDSIVKKELYDTHIRGRFNIEIVVDDRKRVVDMWRQLGLVCFAVAEGDY